MTKTTISGISYTIESGTCANMLNISPSCANPAFPPVTLDEHVNTNLTTIVPGSLCNAIGPDGNNTPGSNDLTNYYEVDGEPTDALLDGLEEPWDVNPNTHVPGSSYAHWDTSANASNPGINLSWDFPTPQYGNNPWSNGIAPSPVYQGSTVDNYGYPIYNGWGDPSAMCSSCYADPNGCIGDGEYAPVMNGVAGSAPGSHAFGQTYTNSGDPTGSSQMSFAFNDGQGPLHTTGNCFQGYCTKMAKTKYTVKDLTAYLYNGNHIPGYQDGVNDTCRQLECKRDSFRVTIKVKINYEQCLPVGQFWGTDVAMTNAPEDLYNDYPYFQFAPQGLAETSPVSITYDVTNAHEIETDDATDDLACLDDDNDMMRTQDFEILPAGDASLNTATVSTCTNSPALNLSSYVSGTTGGTWTANGGNLNGNSFSSSTAGTFTLTYTVGGGDCQDAASLTVTVGQSGSINTAGLPTSVCAGTAVLLPAGTWSGDGVTGDTFSSNTAGTYTLTGTAGSGACATTATVSITVVPELSVAVTQECNGDQAVLL
ncbi:MAG: hypothetical protein IPN94_21850 [Sphingobacteriales bacterium]|nr:hypothetical protein [Sphingobacteriales bacterium]